MVKGWFDSTLRTKKLYIMKVKLLKRVWGYEPGRELDLKGDQLDLVLRKKYAELVPLKKLDPEVKPRKTKVDPALKTRKNK